ncbi:MAG: DUF2203 domain-containing protein [Acidobacteriales bacterium]|nr:DUF2203 domain-containing protein [Terriglobales bacterium]
MSDKTFTLEEANMLLPVLESLLKRAMDGKQSIEGCDKELQELSHKIFLTGGLLVNVVQVARRRAEREKALQSIKDSIQEIHSTGVQVKDLDIGLLDFPCVVHGETVLLCWKYGEGHAVQHWHGLEEGYAGRKSIESLDLDPKKGKRPERPN